MSHLGANVFVPSTAIGTSLALVIRSPGDEEAHIRESELISHLTSWVQQSVGARRIHDIQETMRFAVWTTVRHPDRAVLLAELDGQPAGILLGELKEGPKGRFG
jgi:hypothetical protein